MFRQIALAALIGLPLAAAVHVPSAEAHGVSYVSVRVTPPPPRHERVVVRRGHVWVPGHWNWTGHRHVWVAGYSTPARHGQHYRAGYWERRGPTWHWHAGRWAVDPSSPGALRAPGEPTTVMGTFGAKA